MIAAGDILTRGHGHRPALVVECVEPPCCRVALLWPDHRLALPEAIPCWLLERAGWRVGRRVPEGLL